MPDAFDLGYAAGLADEDPSPPYPDGSAEWHQWLNGWYEAKA